MRKACTISVYRSFNVPMRSASTSANISGGRTIRTYYDGLCRVVMSMPVVQVT